MASAPGAVKTYKYSLAGSEHLASSSARIIELAQAKVIPKPAVYLSLDPYNLAIWARKYLALTYFPSYRSLFKIAAGSFVLTDNVGTRITEDLPLDMIPRVWPAFNQDGGAREVILQPDPNTFSNLKADGPPHPLRDGGKTDPYHQDDVQDYDFRLATEIAQAVVDALGQLDLGDRSLRTVAGKITEDGFLVIITRFSTYHYSLSVGYKILGNQVKIKLWGYIWADEIKIRRLYGPLSEVVTLDPWRQPPALTENVIKARLRHRFERRQYPYHVISGTARHVLKRATGIKDTFFSAYSRTVALH